MKMKLAGGAILAMGMLAALPAQAADRVSVIIGVPGIVVQHDHRHDSGRYRGHHHLSPRPVYWRPHHHHGRGHSWHGAHSRHGHGHGPDGYRDRGWDDHRDHRKPGRHHRDR